MYNLEIKIPISEVKSELGATEKTEENPQIDNLIEESITEAYSLINPQGDYIIIDKFRVNGDKISLNQGEVSFSSRETAELLTNQRKVSLLAVTIGSRLEEKTDELFADDKFTKATILDAVGSVAAEETANELTKIIKKAGEEMGLPYLTMRFSPGYSDLDLEIQPELLKAVGGDEIGITANSSYLLSPQKSITALLGLGEEPGPKPGCDFDCRNCSYDECIYS